MATSDLMATLRLIRSLSLNSCQHFERPGKGCPRVCQEFSVVRFGGGSSNTQQQRGQQQQETGRRSAGRHQGRVSAAEAVLSARHLFLLLAHFKLKQHRAPFHLGGEIVRHWPNQMSQGMRDNQRIFGLEATDQIFYQGYNIHQYTIQMKISIQGITVSPGR